MFDPTIGLDDPIHGDRFVTLADYWWNDRHIQIKQEGGTIITRLPDYMPSDMDEKGGLIFCKTDHIRELFDRIRKSPAKFVLITHNSDHNITEERYSWKPDNVVGWFAQNVVIDRPRLIPIPIGLERPGIAGSGDIEDFKQNWAKKIKKDKLLYVNWADGTNQEERGPLKEALRGIEGITIQDQRLSFREYLAEMSRHYFVLSPPGNGLDCHRTWEAFYCGCIPICGEMWNSYYHLLPVARYTCTRDVIDMMEIADPDGMAELNQWDLNRLGFEWWAKMIEFYAIGWLNDG